MIITHSDIELDFRRHFDRLRDDGGPCGCYRRGTGDRPDLYASIDVALMRGILNEPLHATLDPKQRQQWIDHLNSFAFSEHGVSDGSYFDRLNLGPLHANGQVIGALGLLGGRKRFACRLYEPFQHEGDVVGWLDQAIDWRRIWSESHQFWGGAVFFSRSRRCSDAWRETVFQWLNHNADPLTGWWRRGVATVRRFEALGGAAHILPFYQHNDRPHPFPDRLIDSVLALQDDEHRWMPSSLGHLGGYPLHYLDMDALYVLWVALRWSDGYRRHDAVAAVEAYADVVDAYYLKDREEMFSLHPHFWMSALSIFGLLQRLLPDRYPNSRPWGDIFSRRDFYQTDAVEGDE